MIVLLMWPVVSALRLRCRCRYDGSNFHGVQKNIRTQDGTELRTILSALEQSLWPALKQQVKFHVASRTDAGVSASGQVVVMNVPVLDVDEGESLFVNVHGVAVHISALADAFNACLPADLQMTEVGPVPDKFDVGRDSRWKRYRYRLPPCLPADDDDDGMRVLRMVASHAARAARHRLAELEDGSLTSSPPRRASRRRRALPSPAITNVAAMEDAAALLEGTHDFAAFTARGGDQKGTVRTIFRCAIEPRNGCADSVSVDEASGAGEMDAYDIVVEGDGFLYKQVRIVAGTLLMVGMGLVPPETILIALSSDEREGGPLGDRDKSGKPMSKGQLRSLGVVGPTLPPERLSV